MHAKNVSNHYALSMGLLSSPENTPSEEQAGRGSRQFVFERSELTQRRCPQRGAFVFWGCGLASFLGRARKEGPAGRPHLNQLAEGTKKELFEFFEFFASNIEQHQTPPRQTHPNIKKQGPSNERTNPRQHHPTRNPRGHR
ncbi:hypothetical protein WAE56_14315 [Iodobacter sp. LRB]|uniref:hypothetical protein n=1 Tax=unclassified Iodobacter TaxID=235634 RepID=UPI00117B1B7B|nr:hypothetical protein [Iodobacter sp. BJB302]